MGTCCLIGTPVLAGDLDTLYGINSSPNPLGSGARALGMGSAFIAVADDATAASWNPAGLVQLERPEISAVGQYFNRTETPQLGGDAASGDSTTVSDTRLNYLSAAYPFSFLKRNMIVSINFQNLYDFTSEQQFTRIDASSVDPEQQEYSYKSNGSLSAVAVAYAIQVVPTISLGMTLNFWEDSIYDNAWEERRSFINSGFDAGEAFTSELNTWDKYTFRGVNANVGVMWNPTASLSLGAVLKTPFDADVTHDVTINTAFNYPELEDSYTYSEYQTSEKGTLRMPMSYGLGLAYRISDALTLSGDIYRTEWDEYIFTDEDGNKRSFITGRPESQSDVDPTLQVRLGAEYLIIRNNYAVPLRGGIFSDQAPAQGSPDEYYGLSLGSGLALKRFALDLAYQYRFGRDVGGSGLEEYAYSKDVDEHTIYTSLIIYF